jgi:alpha-beta hydrolase superfamily lysophospholipase
LAEPACTIATHKASDGYVWRYRRYLPPTNMRSRAHVVVIHGVQSHGGWYEYSCTQLAQAGYTVSFLDRRGSGLNDRARGDTPNFRRLLDDIVEFLTPSPPHLVTPSPTFLIGISWGGKLAVALPHYRPGLVDGVVLICPGFFPRVTARQKRLAFIASVIGMVRPTQRFPIPLNDPELFTATPRWQQFLRDDSLALHKATGRFLGASLHLDRYVQYVPHQFQLPALLMLAQKDRIIENIPTRRFFRRFASVDKQIIEYASAHHTLEFEPARDRFVGDLIGWLEKHDGARGG